MWPSVSTVYHLTLRGWPECRQQVLRIARHVWGAWDELSIEASLLLKATQVCVPQELLNCALVDLHGPHQGIDKMQAQARKAVYWPSINADIVNYVCWCTICTKHKASPLHSLCYPGIFPMACGRRSLPTISPTRVKSTCSSAIFSGIISSIQGIHQVHPFPILALTGVHLTIWTTLSASHQQCPSLYVW